MSRRDPLPDARHMDLERLRPFAEAHEHQPLPQTELHPREPVVPLVEQLHQVEVRHAAQQPGGDRKSTRLNSSHSQISYAVFCLKKKKKTPQSHRDFTPTPPPTETACLSATTPP